MTRIAGILATLAVAGLVAVPAFAETHTDVHVSLWDKGESSMDAFGDGPPMGMAMAADKTKATMGITPDVTTVKAGEITLIATNDSKDFIHEMVVAPVADPSTPLPYDKDEGAVDEEAAGAIGEVSETDPGDSGQVTLHLKPGTYVLFCNVPGHYAMGMWTLLTVTQ